MLWTSLQNVIGAAVFNLAVFFWLFGAEGAFKPTDVDNWRVC